MVRSSVSVSPFHFSPSEPPVNSPRHLPALVGILACVTGVGLVARADAPVAAAAKPESSARPAKLRLWHVGNSWSCPFPFEQVGGFDRPFLLGTHKFNDGKGPNWLDQALERDKKKVLEKGDYDAIYLGFVQLTMPVESIDKLADVAVKHKPDARIYLQHAWASGGGPWAPGGRSSIGTLRDDDDLAAIQVEWDKRRKKLEDKTDEINKGLGGQHMFIIPVADAVMKMRRLVVAGQLPGVTKQSHLFCDKEVEPFARDDHGASHIAVLTVYCAHAAIYRKSPEGMPVPAGTGYWMNIQADGGKPPVTAEAHAVLQKLAWEVVSAYPYAGVPGK